MPNKKGGVNMYTFQLCEGRHPIPKNPPALFPQRVNPLDVDALYCVADAVIPADAESVTVYVTGLTVAFAAVVSVCTERRINLTAMHFDRDTGDWYSQPVISCFGSCPYGEGRIYTAVAGGTCSLCGACS